MTKNFYVNFFTSNTIYGEYMACIRYERKYCYMKISNTILQTKLIQIMVEAITVSLVHQEHGHQKHLEGEEGQR